jgi:hypothetical protein
MTTRARGSLLYGAWHAYERLCDGSSSYFLTAKIVLTQVYNKLRFYHKGGKEQKVPCRFKICGSYTDLGYKALHSLGHEPHGSPRGLLRSYTQGVRYFLGLQAWGLLPHAGSFRPLCEWRAPKDTLHMGLPLNLDCSEGACRTDCGGHGDILGLLLLPFVFFLSGEVRS